MAPGRLELAGWLRLRARPATRWGQTMAMGLAGFQIEMVESLDETITALELRHAPRRDSLRPG